jgi:BURP domain
VITNDCAKNRVKVQEGMNQHAFILSGPLPSPDYVRRTFFPIKDMYTGSQMNQGLNFDQTIVGGAFVPRTEADRIQFSSWNLPQILDHFSMAPGSKEAKQIERILKDCEEPTLTGEQKFCSTSLESMIDNVVSLLETTDIKALSTAVSRSKGDIVQNGKAMYTIASPMKKIPYHSRLVICHQEPSPEAVHYCHTNIAYEGYMVSLVGNDGSKVNAVAVCHHDTINFNRLFLELLNVEPGVEPVCHFLPENHLIWVSNQALGQAEDICSDCVA